MFDALTKSNICEAHYYDDEPSYFGKEVHFFDEPERFEKGPSFYCSRFSMCRSRSNNITQIDLHIPTDATPNYLNFGIASQMKETFPPSAIEKIKIIVVLREPVGRLLSWYNHVRALYAKVGEEECRKIYCKDYLRSSSEANINVTVHVKDTQARSLYDNLISFEELFDMNKWSVNLGEYVDILQEFFDVFRMENFLILNYDYLLKKNTLALSNIADFLNIPDVWKKKYRMIVKNELRNYSDKLKLEDIDCRIVEKIDEYYSSYNTRLYQILNNKSKLFSSQMQNCGQFEKLPKCSKTEYFNCPH